MARTNLIGLQNFLSKWNPKIFFLRKISKKVFSRKKNMKKIIKPSERKFCNPIKLVRANFGAPGTKIRILALSASRKSLLSKLQQRISIPDRLPGPPGNLRLPDHIGKLGIMTPGFKEVVSLNCNPGIVIAARGSPYEETSVDHPALWMDYRGQPPYITLYMPKILEILEKRYIWWTLYMVVEITKISFFCFTY